MTARAALAVTVADGAGGRDALVVSGAAARGFCDGMVAALMDGRLRGDPWFPLGLAAMMDALARGTVDFADPAGFALRARADLERAGGPFSVTDVLAAACERGAAPCAR